MNWEHVRVEGKVPARMIYQAFEMYGEKSRYMDKSIDVIASDSYESVMRYRKIMNIEGQ